MAHSDWTRAVNPRAQHSPALEVQLVRYTAFFRSDPLFAASRSRWWMFSFCRPAPDLKCRSEGLIVLVNGVGGCGKSSFCYHTRVQYPIVMTLSHDDHQLPNGEKLDGLSTAELHSKLWSKARCVPPHACSGVGFGPGACCTGGWWLTFYVHLNWHLPPHCTRAAAKF